MARSNENSHDSGTYIRCMWLDSSVHDAGASQQMQKELCKIFGRCAFVENKDKGRQAITNSPVESKLLLVVSGQIGSELVPLIHNEAKVCAIYVYCGNVNNHIGWSQGYTKVSFSVLLCLFIIRLFIQVKLVTDNPNKLIEQIKTDKPNL